MVKHRYKRVIIKNEKFDSFKKVLSRLTVILHWIEVLIVIMVMSFVVFGIINIIQSGVYLELIQGDFYQNFEGILSEMLLIIIGVELAILLIRRRPESLVEVMFFVVAKKMLVGSHDPLEILMGVAAIGGLFAIRKYLEHETPERQRLRLHK